MITNKEIDRKALVELSEIISHMNKDLQARIPKDLCNNIEQNKDTSYKFKYEKNVELMPETKALLSVILSEYVCSDANKEKWKIYDKKASAIIENEKRKKYSVDVFGNNNTDKTDDETSVTQSSLAVVSSKENWLKKIINKIKSIFRKS